MGRTEILEELTIIFQNIFDNDSITITENMRQSNIEDWDSFEQINIVAAIQRRFKIQFPISVMLKCECIGDIIDNILKLLGDGAKEILTLSKDEFNEKNKVSSVMNRMFALHSVDPERLDYNLPFTVSINGELDLSRLQMAINSCLKSNPMLTARFYNEDSLFYRIRPTMTCPLETEIFFAENEDDIQKIRSNVLKSFIKPFFLESDDLLMRAKVVQYGNQKFLLFLDFHHIIFDGFSVNIFFRDLQKAYKFTDCSISKPYEYCSFVNWQNKYVQSAEYKKKAEYWKELFDEMPLTCNLITDFSSEPKDFYTTACVKKNIWCKKQVAELCHKYGCTKNVFFTSIFAITLSVLCAQKSVSFATAVSGRNTQQLKEIIGMFVNTLPVLLEVDGTQTYSEFLKYVNENNGMLLQNADVLYETIMENPSAKDVIKSIVDVSFRYQESYHDLFKLNGMDCCVEQEMTPHSVTNILFMVDECEDSFEVYVHYASELYKSETIDRMVDLYFSVAEYVLEHPEIKLDQIPLCSEQQTMCILHQFNPTSEPCSTQTVVDLFEEVVQKYPDNIAVAFGEETITYKQLNEKINALAHRLRDISIRPNDFVGIIAERSIEMIIAIYGVIKAGGAYVPIDSSYPQERIEFILNDCKPKAVLCYKTQLNENCLKIDLEQADSYAGATQNPVHVNKPDDLVYCIYTSGTTGMPKGVLIEHQNLVNLHHYFETSIGITAADNVAQFFNIVFDGSVWEITMALLSGAELVIADEEERQSVDKFEALIQRHNISVAALPPMVYANLIKANLRITITAGSEALPSSISKAVSNGGTYLNSYGPTENTVAATGWLCREFDDTMARVPIGKPIDNVQVYILQNDRLCGVGIPGELCIAGASLARGYLNRPELTDEKFVKNPFGDGKLYHSGDMARWLPDGTIEYLGRTDAQVKIRGFRIELGEVENKIRQLKCVKDCAVIARQDASGDKAIFVYYTNDVLVHESELRERLSRFLPEYMLPSYMMQIDEIPLTRNGKLDVRALPEVVTKSVRNYIAPRNEIEEAVCEAFCKVLKLSKVGVKDRFIELGGDSIKAIRLIYEFRSMGYTLTVKDIMSGSTPEQISLNISGAVRLSSCQQGEVTGMVQKTPIMKTFECWNFAKPEHFNQAIMLHVNDISNADIKTAITALVKQHDMLRAVYRDQELEIISIAQSKLFDFFEFDYSDLSDNKAVIEAKCTEIQESMDLNNGPLVKVVVFKLHEDKIMLLCVHHLLIDGISCRILSEDFFMAISQIKASKEIVLPEKTESFIKWSQLLNKYKDTEQFAVERNYWKKEEQNIVSSAFHYDENKKKCAEQRNISFELTKQETDHLLFHANESFHTEINDLLLSALTAAVEQLSMQKRVTVFLEGHGREKLHCPVEIDRTVGWFTSIYPVVLEKHDNWDDTIISNKNKLHAIPNKGIGYGLLDFKHIDGGLSFNYLGVFDDETQFGNGNFSIGQTISDQNRIPNDISCDLIVTNGILKCHMLYRQDKFAPDTIYEFASFYKKALIEVIDYCINYGQTIMTASDFNDELSTSDFDEIMGSLTL